MSDEYRPPSAVVLELTGLIYDSVDDGSRWPAFMDAFARAIDAPRCALLIRDREEDIFTAVRWHGWSDEDVQLYSDRYGPTDPQQITSSEKPEGTVATDYELCPRDEFEASAVFREFYAPRGYIHSIGGMILQARTGHSLISAHRGADAGPFGEKEKSILRQLMPHLKRVALLHGEFASLRRQVVTFTGHLERLPYAFLLVDATRRILYSNAAAREIVLSQDGLIKDNGRFAAISRQAEAGLGKAIDELYATRGHSLRRLEIPRPSRRKAYRVLLMPIHDARMTVPLGAAVPAVSIVVIDAESRLGPDPEVLRELFSLTPAEARVSGMLALGQSLAEIATETGTSAETIRTHLKRILSKTGASRQGELISLILRSTRFGV
jgi:DNA-binding CsgD family transcriptional regulator